MKVDFATFCYSGDAHRLHQSGQLAKQVDSNNYLFNQVIVVYQQCSPMQFEPFGDIGYPLKKVVISDIDQLLTSFNINLTGQYQSPTDTHHNWKYHVANHLAAIVQSSADYIVFADNDCWIVRQPFSWVKIGIGILEGNSRVFIVSPNDGEPERMTQTMSQQMFLVRTSDFKNMDFNQPGWDGNVRNHPEMPEYHGMLEGRIHHYCVHNDKYRYVLDADYRYFHHNVIKENGTFETDYQKLGWV